MGHSAFISIKANNLFSKSSLLKFSYLDQLATVVLQTDMYPKIEKKENPLKERDPVPVSGGRSFQESPEEEAEEGDEEAEKEGRRRWR